MLQMQALVSLPPDYTLNTSESRPTRVVGYHRFDPARSTVASTSRDRTRVANRLQSTRLVGRLSLGRFRTPQRTPTATIDAKLDEVGMGNRQMANQHALGARA